MLLNALPGGSAPAATPESPPLDGGRAHSPVAAPLRGRALLAQLEALAQRELAQLATQGERAHTALPRSPDPALAGLAWDLGLSGDALARSHPDGLPVALPAATKA